MRNITVKNQSRNIFKRSRSTSDWDLPRKTLSSNNFKNWRTKLGRGCKKWGKNRRNGKRCISHFATQSLTSTRLPLPGHFQLRQGPSKLTKIAKRHRTDAGRWKTISPKMSIRWTRQWMRNTNATLASLEQPIGRNKSKKKRRSALVRTGANRSITSWCPRASADSMDKSEVVKTTTLFH